MIAGTVGVGRWLVASVALATLLVERDASALIPIPVGGHPQELDVFARVTLERGLVEPNENKASWQKANWEMLTVGGGYGLGHFGVFQDLSVRAEITGYQSPAEVNDVSKGAVSASQCSGTPLGPGECQFHPSDKGTFVTPSISTSLVHTATVSLGVFLVGNIPIGVNYEKFALPRIDYVGGGFRTGIEFEPWFAFETSFYVGSGSPRPGRNRQNGTFAATQLLHFRTGRLGTSPFFRLGIKVGPYVDGDLIGERTDARYDQAYTSGYPDRTDPAAARGGVWKLRIFVGQLGDIERRHDDRRCAGGRSSSDERLAPEAGVPGMVEGIRAACLHARRGWTLRDGAGLPQPEARRVDEGGWHRTSEGLGGGQGIPERRHGRPPEILIERTRSRSTRVRQLASDLPHPGGG